MIQYYRGISTLLFLFVSTVFLAQNPHGYYNNASGKKHAELKTALHEIIRHHTILGYGSLWVVFRETDEREDGTVWDMYSPIARTFNTTLGLNREHSFPRSWWGGDTDVAANTDLNHIFPSDAEANMAKSNYPMGVVGSNPSYNNGMTKVGHNIYPGYTGSVFEPDDEYKGDFARAYLYMVTRYQDYYNKWRYLYMLDANTYPVFKPWAINLLLEWHREDPVSLKELERNEAVFRIQGNRNPFIDFPELAEYIWGYKMDEEWVIDTSITQPVLITPTNDTQLEFGTVVLGEAVHRTLFIRGNNLSEPLSVFLYGADAAQFSIHTDEVPSALANSSEGYELQVTYTPSEIADSHNATLMIYEGGIDGSVIVNIHASNVSAETLSSPVALAASHISSSGFRANWEEAPQTDFYILNVYSHTNDSHKLLFSEEDIFVTHYDVSGLQQGIDYSYNLEREVRGLRTSPSNTIEVRTVTGISDVDAGNDLFVMVNDRSIHVSFSYHSIRFIEIFNTSGQLLFREENPAGEVTFTVSVPGVYFLNVGGVTRKVVVKP